MWWPARLDPLHMGALPAHAGGSPSPGGWHVLAVGDFDGDRLDDSASRRETRLRSRESGAYAPEDSPSPERRDGSTTSARPVRPQPRRRKESATNAIEPRVRRRAPWGALVVALVPAWGCRGPAVAPPAPPVPVGLETAPILWAQSEVAYRDFRAEPLEALHAELAELLGEPLLFRVIPIVEPQGGPQGEPATPVLRGETLEVYYQETQASVGSARRKVDQVVRRVRAAFPGLDANDRLLIHVRLPDGKKVADLDRRATKECGARNNIRTDVPPSLYVPGRLEGLTFVLCDGPAVLDARLQDPEWPLVAENWSTDDRSR